MSRHRMQPASTAWLLIGLVAGLLLITGTILPRWCSALLFAVALVAYLRSGTRPAPEAEGGTGG